MRPSALFAALAAALLFASPAAAQDGRFESEIAAFEAADAAAKPQAGGVLFLGSSSIRMWDGLAQDFPNVRVINRGFGGSQIEDSLHYFDRIVAPLRPSTIVFYAGDNDLDAGKTPQRVLADYQALTARVHKALPRTRLLFLSIKPSIARWHLAAPIRAANALVRDYSATDKRLSFIDIYPAMLGSDGKPRPELFAADGLHMSRAGYAIWRDAVRPYLKR